MGAAGAVAGAQAGLQLYGSYEESQALKAQGEYQKQQAEAQAQLLEMKAKDIRALGARKALETQTRAGSVRGSQRAAYAGQGVDVSSGSAADIQDETVTLGEMDALTVKNNAWREAFGYQTEAGNTRLEGNNANLAAKQKARMTLLTGGLQAAGTGASAFAKGGA